MLGNSNAFVNGLVSGWEVAGIFIGRSGPPYTPVLSSDVANNGTSGQWPNRISREALYRILHRRTGSTLRRLRNQLLSPMATRDATSCTRTDCQLWYDREEDLSFGETRSVELRLSRSIWQIIPNFSAPTQPLRPLLQPLRACNPTLTESHYDRSEILLTKEIACQAVCQRLTVANSLRVSEQHWPLQRPACRAAAQSSCFYR
jgi:hypothetical protein